MTEDDVNFEYLKERCELAFSNIPTEYWRFYSKKSVDNFIYYFPKIKGRSEKEEIASSIKAYLTKIEAGFADVPDIHFARQLFETDLYPIARKFEWRQGFIPISSLRGLLFLVPLFALFFWLIFIYNHTLSYLLMILFSLYLVRVVIKIRNRKVYGLTY